MGARRGKFDEEEAGSLVENNLVASACVVSVIRICFALRFSSNAIAVIA
jgi:hypothetical protein